MANLGCLIPYRQLLARFRGGFNLPGRFEQFTKSRLVLITLRALAIGQNPFGMLRAQIFVNLPLEFSVIVDLARHRSKQAFKCGAGPFLSTAWQNGRRAHEVANRVSSKNSDASSRPVHDAKPIGSLCIAGALVRRQAIHFGSALESLQEETRVYTHRNLRSKSQMPPLPEKGFEQPSYRA